MIAQVDLAYVRMHPTKLLSRLVSYALFEGRPLTTRGQWINPLLFAHFALEKRLPQMRSVEKPIFILGTGRSGTTILGVLLSMHRDVGFLNEPKALWHSIYPYEDVIGSYSRGDAYYRLEASDVDASIKRNAHHLFGAYLTSVLSSRLVDKYPEVIFRVPFVREIFPDAKFIFLVRNGWDTCNSIVGWSDRMGKQVGREKHDWWGAGRRKWNLLVDQLVPEHSDLAPYAEVMSTWTSYTDMSALEWILTMREGIKLLEKYPNDVLRVNFEELCREPKEELLSIAKFFDLENDDRFLRYGEVTLKPVAAYPHFKLDTSIELAYMDIMRALGYEV